MHVGRNGSRVGNQALKPLLAARVARVGASREEENGDGVEASHCV